MQNHDLRLCGVDDINYKGYIHLHGAMYHAPFIPTMLAKMRKLPLSSNTAVNTDMYMDKYTMF